MLTLTRNTDLQDIGSSMSWNDRIKARVSNIEMLCATPARAFMLLGAELAACKWSGEFIVDDCWTEDDISRSWEAWLERRDFRYVNGDRACKVNKVNASAFMAWSSVAATIQAANAERNIPLPLPTSPSQIEPYLSELDRVDDWSPEEWPEREERGASFETQPPYALEQPRFVARWEQVWNTLPPEKRINRRGEPVPPARNESRTFIQQLRKAETPDAPEPEASVNVGATTPNAEEWQKAGRQAATARPVIPQKTEREKAAERAAYELEQSARKYRMALLSLQQASDALENFLKGTIAKAGTSDILEQMRDLDLGPYSVTEDVEMLRKSVLTLQRSFKLATEEYVAPAGIEVDVNDVSNRTVTV